MNTRIYNIAELRARRGAANVIVETLGYYTPSDGGGNTFYWDNASTTTDDGGSVIAVTGVATGRWIATINLIVNVKQFGAKGDGSTVDTTSINAAIATTKDIYFPKGTYIVNSNLIPLSNQTFFGDGNQSIIKSNTDGLKIFNITGVSKVVLRNFAINGGGQTTNVFTGVKGNRGVYCTNATDIVISNLYIEKVGIVKSGDVINDNTPVGQGGYGIHIESRNGLVENILIKDCTIRNIAGGGNNWGDGIAIAGFNANTAIIPKNITVVNCYVDTVARHCYSVAGGAGESTGANVTFNNIVGKSSCLSGIDLEEGSNVVVENARFEACGITNAYYNPQTIYNSTYNLCSAIVTGNLSNYNSFKNVVIKDCYYGLNWGAGTNNIWDTITITNSTINDLMLGLARFGEDNIVRNCNFLTTGKTSTPFYNYATNCNVLVENCIFNSLLVLAPQKNNIFRKNIFKKTVSFQGGTGDLVSLTFDSCTFLDTRGLHFSGAHLAEDFIITNCKFLGSGTAYYAGIHTTYNSVIRMVVTNCLFKGYTGDGGEDGRGIYHANSDSQNAFATIANNSFVNCKQGIYLYQGNRYGKIIGNTFSNISAWCINIFGISASLGFRSNVISNNVADNTCVNGLQIDCPTGTWDFCRVANNDFSAVTTTAYTVNVNSSNNINGITEIPFPILPIKLISTAYTLVLGDSYKTIESTSASAIIITIPTFASVAFPIGTQILVAQNGAGQLTFAGAGGVTLRSRGAMLKTNAQYSIATLIKRASDEWYISGDLTT